jgi:hypothetical protein
MYFRSIPGRFFLFILGAVCLFWPHPVNALDQVPASGIVMMPVDSISELNTASKGGLFQNIEGLCLYEVVGGQRRKIAFSRRDLESGKALVSKGYVSGVVLISESPNMAAMLEDRQMERQVEGSGLAKGIADQAMDADERLDSGQHYYAYFPRVLGDAVSPKDQFCVSIHDGNSRETLTIRQNGYQCIPQVRQAPSAQAAKPVFRYAGSDLSQFLSDLDDLEERLQAIKSGIGLVEKTFGLELVEFVNILPYKGPDNALTLKGQSHLWFYADTIRSQRISELRSMAEHEALHILVDRSGYTRMTALKELFADLMGYGLFSRERFLFVTTGALPDPAVRSLQSAKPLLAFINEKNFIPGMSGGHAGDTLDEFSTSFLHALLYLDQLEQNLRKSELIMADGSRMLLTAESRGNILKDFLRTLAVFMDEDPLRTNSFSIASCDFFERCMASAARVRPEPWGVFLNSR